MPAGKVQTTDMRNQHLIHRHDTIFPTPDIQNLKNKKNAFNIKTKLKILYSDDTDIFQWSRKMKSLQVAKKWKGLNKQNGMKN
jgi:hypothetical protein